MKLAPGGSAALLALFLAAAAPARSEPPAEPPDAAAAAPSAPEVIEDVEVRGRSEDLVGIADTATQGIVGAEELRRRPILRPGEMLETVPGVIISQHSGEGKANQYYLRGFNLDHGTDFATYVDGMPVNMPTHAHGQGYTDLNFLIPELVREIRYEKGAYNVGNGDFSAAGTARLRYFNTLAAPLNTVTLGSFNYRRLVTAGSTPQGGGNLLYGVELFHNDGPWKHPNDFRKANGVLRYSGASGNSRYHATGMVYSGRWNATDQIPRRAVEEGLISRFGAIDPTDGGSSARYSLSGELQRDDAHGTTRANAYAISYRMNLFSNFTYFLDDRVNGDQFEQADRRTVLGARVRRQWSGESGGRAWDNEAGLETRHDDIPRVGLYHTKDQQRLAAIRQDSVRQTSLAAYFQNHTQWNPWFRSVLGLRADRYHFDVNSSLPVNSGTRNDTILSPKASLILGPFRQTEVYTSAGYGFHSNDARGTTIQVDPGTGEPAKPVTPLVRAREAEIGIRTARVKGLQSTLSLWYLHLDSELLFTGDAGTTEPSFPTRRTGIEFANFYTPAPGWTIDADFSTSRARFQDVPASESHIPGALETVLALGVSYDGERTFGSLRVRYFGPRPLVEDNTVRSGSTTLMNARVGAQVGKNARVALDVFNLLNSATSDIDYYYASRLPGEPAAGVDDVHFHPAESRAVRLSFIAGF